MNIVINKKTLPWIVRDATQKFKKYFTRDFHFDFIRLTKSVEKAQIHLQL